MARHRDVKVTTSFCGLTAANVFNFYVSYIWAQAFLLRKLILDTCLLYSVAPVCLNIADHGRGVRVTIWGYFVKCGFLTFSYGLGKGLTQSTRKA